MFMTRGKWLLLGGLIVVVAGAALAAARLHRHREPPNPWLSPPEDAGDYAGPVGRTIAPYDPAKAPSRPWLDAKRTAPAPATYHRYAAASLNGGQTDYLLYLPPGYDEAGNSQRRYPVVYWLHGYDSEPQDGMPFVDGVDAAIRAGQAPAMIVVLPNGLKDSWYVDTSDGAQPMESVIIKDLIPHIDASYRTIADRRGRAVEGFSMGGWGALHLAFKYPEMLGAVTAVSAPFHRHDQFWQLKPIFNGEAAGYYAEDPVTMARRDPAKIARVRIRLLCGEKDQLGHLAYNRMFDKRLGEWGIVHETVIVPGVDHSEGGIYERLGAGAFGFYKSAFAGD